MIELCLLFLLSVGNSWASLQYKTTSHHWDLLIFTQHWPNTVCIQWEEKANHTCLLTQEWAVHGVWPTKLGTIGPGFCNNSWHFDQASLAPIQTKLDKDWPNIENGTAEDSLWKHEWMKHGTCAAQLPAFNTELKYFTQGLEWHDQYNFIKALSSAGVVPSTTKTYHVKDIWDAVKKYTQKNPAIECFHDAKTGNTYLMEIRVCFDKKLTLIDCDGIVGPNHRGMGGIITNCPVDRTIVYPDSVPGAIDPYKIPSGWTMRDYVEFLLWLQWLTF